jgi:hypothetical protein
MVLDDLLTKHVAQRPEKRPLCCGSTVTDPSLEITRCELRSFKKRPDSSLRDHRPMYGGRKLSEFVALETCTLECLRVLAEGVRIPFRSAR